MREEEIKSQLTERFPFLEKRIYIPRERRIFVGPMGKDDFKNVLQYLIEDGDFHNFHMICGMQIWDDLQFIYVLSNSDHTILNLKLSVPMSNPVIDSVMNYFPNALWHEREVVDLLGAVVEGLPEGPHYPLPDGWPEGNYPLRKDWRPENFDRNTLTYHQPEAIPEENTSDSEKQ